MKAYVLMARNALMASLTYRAHMVFQFLGSGLALVVLWFFWKAVYDAAGVPELRGMSLGQTVAYAGLGAALFVLMRSWVEWDLHWQVRSGDIVVHFFRPYHLMGVTLATALGNVASNALSITVPTLLTLYGLLGAAPPSWVALLWAIPALVQAYLLSFLVDFAVGLVAFRTESIWGFSFTKEMLVLFLSGGLVPLAFFPELWKPVLLVLPFASMYNTPIGLLAGTLTDPAQIVGRLLLQTFWLAVLYGAVTWAYRHVVKHLTVAGG